MPNSWISFVKEYAKEHDLKYACAVINSDCRQSYKNRNIKPVIPVEELKTPNKKERELIQKFMIKHRHKIRLEYLKAICSDSGVCIAFGRESEKIKDFFNGFVNFDFIVKPIKKIGEPSSNGFVHEIKYEREGYKSYAVLKSAASFFSDNLVYEYIVGQFINKQNKLFPCFLETYGLYYYTDDRYWSGFKNAKSIDNVGALNTILQLQTNPYDYARMCSQSKYACILIQHLKNVKTLGYRSEKSPTFLIHDLLFVLYQVYMPLSILNNTFTHYDLHTENVLLYEPIKGKHIKYHYHIDNQIISFNSPYLVKIIDYGRSFVSSTNSNLGPNEIRTELCNEPKCTSLNVKTTYSCGFNFGFQFFNPSANPADDYYINTLIPNQSHDLRLLKILKEQINKKGQFRIIPETYESLTQTKQLCDFISKVKYGKFGTKQELKSGLPSKINNITDAELGLRNIILSKVIQDNNTLRYNSVDKIGDIHVYSDGSPMKYEPA